MKPHIIILMLMLAAFIPEVVFIVKLFSNKTASANLPKITLRVNAGVFVMACVLLAVVIVYDINFLKYKTPIDYSKWKEIEWSDFRAIKRPQQTLHGNQNFAFICSEIDHKFKENALEITTLFHPARSYTFSEEIAGKNLLQHELYHLHITEYWSRLLRKEITTLAIKSDKSGIIGLIEEHKQNERIMQHQYDDETYHGYVLGEQRIWQRRIDSCLSSLKTYSKPIINFKN